ncbi:cupin domain-containing protein [Nodosilinea sp. LEGE 07088]|uniref:cupin domain-containing protein n=1 Tax=Nodosilinea sp. LEGE 07088 TaxID=2777968 RepID=UPI00187DF8EC|nr:cupin domain-containing protein [Nodosilinea sp. LEGE 07088]MBE9136044.1 cupin domain-containing protein [Nodosilinea sp. LEGE 07088]
MKSVQSRALMVLGLVTSVGYGLISTPAMAEEMSESTTETRESGLANSNVVDLAELTANPSNYDFFTFRPNLEKLILSGAADTEHISILWYTIPDGSVGLHYHSMTESVYAIAGTQTDAKGVYPTGSLYFNPPGSGHSISDSTGFFILAYASPPDFANTDLIQDYTPVQINTADPDFETMYPFAEAQAGVSVYSVPLDPAGGMSSQFIQSTSLESYEYIGNYLLVLRGSCTIDGTTFDQDQLVVATTIDTQAYQVSAVEGGNCLALGLSF